MYEAGKATRILGCLVPLTGFLAVTTCTIHNFFDVSSNRSSAECQSLMQARILSKLAALPSNAVLSAKHVTVEHWLVGNRDQTEPLQRSLNASGIGASVGPREIGSVLVIQDPVIPFRRRANDRVGEICRFAATNHLQYDSWWVSGDRFSEYVSQ